MYWILVTYFLTGLAGPHLTDTQVSREVRTCTVEGRVVRQGSNEGLSKARVFLRNAVSMYRLPSSEERAPHDISLTAVTDTEGRFRFEDVEPGDYVLAADRVGFVAARNTREVKGRTKHYLSLKACDHITDILIPLTPTGAISGRIFDPDGDPVHGVLVQAVARAPLGRNAMQSSIQHAETNDLGEFRLYHLPPGRYYVIAAPRGDRSLSAPSRQDPHEQDGGRIEVAPVYFPGVSHPGAAQPVEVRASQETRIALTLTTHRTHSIRGRVTPVPTEDSKRRIQVHAIPIDTDDGGPARGFSAGSFAYLGPAQGSFELWGLPSGPYYVLAVEIEEGNGETAWGRVRVDVPSGATSNLEIALSKGVRVAGRMRFREDFPPGKGEWSVTLRSVEDEGLGARSAYATVKPDGSFEFERVYDGEYWLVAGNLEAPDYSVEWARAGNVDLLREPLRVTGMDATSLDIIMARGRAVISGKVIDPFGDPVPGALVLVMDEHAAQRKSLERMPIETKMDGTFVARGLLTGRYFVAAIEADDFDPLGSPWSFDWEGLLKRSRPVRVEIGDNPTIELILTNLE